MAHNIVVAAKYGDIPSIDKLLKERCDINLTDRSGNTALLWAIKTDQIFIINKLLKARPDVNLADNWNNTPLIIAVKRSLPDVVKQLIDHGADINAKDRHGNTPLILAINKSSIAIVNQLIKRDDLKIDFKNHFGETALVKAISHNAPAIVEKLLRLGADLNTYRHPYGVIAIALAQEDEKTIQLLIDYLYKINKIKKIIKRASKRIQHNIPDKSIGYIIGNQTYHLQLTIRALENLSQKENKMLHKSEKAVLANNIHLQKRRFAKSSGLSKLMSEHSGLIENICGEVASYLSFDELGQKTNTLPLQFRNTQRPQNSNIFECKR